MFKKVSITLALLVACTNPSNVLAVDCEEFLAGTQPGETRTCEEKTNWGVIIGAVAGVALIVYVIKRVTDDDDDDSQAFNERDVKEEYGFSVAPSLTMENDRMTTGFNLEYKF